MCYVLKNEKLVTNQHQDDPTTETKCYLALAESPTTEEELLEEQAWDDKITVEQVVFKDLNDETAHKVRAFDFVCQIKTKTCLHPIILN